MSESKPRARPLEAFRALRELVRNPDDTAQVFRILRALPSGDHVFRRFRRDPVGARLLAERPALIDALRDQQRLEALPEGSLGRIYADFVSREQITADGLVDASVAAPPNGPLDPERQYVGERLRDMHDLWHVVTGYNRDLLGEAALLAFTFAQTRTPGIGLIVLYALARARGDFAPARGIIWQGFRRGLGAAWLPAQDWESLLTRPLDEVRETLAVGEPPSYGELRSAGAPVAA